LEQKKAAEACEAFSACVALAPNSGWCFYNRGLAYLEANRSEEALLDFDQALALEPNLAAVHLGKSAIYQKSADWSRALDELQKAQDRGISIAEIEYRRALVSVAQKNREAALNHLKACLKEEPEHAKAKELLLQVEAATK
jgi:tetratricopeptide (TPR) repeat protein